MQHSPTSKGRNVAKSKPYAMVGSGKLASSIWKTASERAGWQYRFNLFRLAGSGRVGQLLRPTDLKHLVKLVQVLAAVLSDDGCLPSKLRGDLRRLAAELDAITKASE